MINVFLQLKSEFIFYVQYRSEEISPGDGGWGAGTGREEETVGEEGGRESQVGQSGAVAHAHHREAPGQEGWFPAALENIQTF